MNPHIFKLREKLRDKITLKTIQNKIKEFKENHEEINKDKQRLIIGLIAKDYFKKVNENYRNTTPEHEAYNLLNNGPNKKNKIKKFKKELKKSNIKNGNFSNNEIENIAKTDKMRKMLKIENLNN